MRANRAEARGLAHSLALPPMSKKEKDKDKGKEKDKEKDKKGGLFGSKADNKVPSPTNTAKGALGASRPAGPAQPEFEPGPILFDYK